MKWIFTLFIFLILAFMIFDEEMQAGMIFFPGKLEKEFRFERGEEVYIPTPDNESINALYFNNSSDKVILYFHGNAGDLSSWQFVADELNFTSAGLLIIDYRGYGKSSGKPGEQGFYIDAQAAYDFLLNEKGFKPADIIIYGRSIGSGVATEIAANNENAALILESPFSSLLDLAKHLYPYLFPQLFLSYKFDNVEKINKVKSKLLILHGTSDDVVPFESGKKLFEAFNGQKEFVAIKNGGHNNLSQFVEFRKGMEQFINSLNH
jgi:uncharacterized protein